MADDELSRLAVKQRKRLVAGILNTAEAQPWWSKLSTQEQRWFRQTVFDKIGVYHDFMLDVIGVRGEDQLINEQAFRLIEQVRDSQRRIEAQANVRDD